jgi:hypothetical protein
MGIGSALIGALRVTLSLDSAAFAKGADLAQKQLGQMGKRMQSMGDRITGIGAKMSVGITAPFAALVSAAVPAAIESRQALGQVEAALASMGPVAGKTSEQLQKAAKSLESISTFDDDDILRKVTANLLTFGNISGQAFDRAQQAAVNLSARLGQDLQSSAIQVGKALNDPIKGMVALGRVGIQFSEDQKAAIKAMVETGNLAGAQGVILGELERQFGGAALAMRKASPTAEVQQQWRTFQERIGELALKVLPPLTNFLTRLIELFNSLSPTTQTWVVGLVALSAALGPVLLVVGQLLSIGGALLPLIVKMGPAFTVLVTVIKALGPVLVAVRVGLLALLSNPFVLGAAALITGIYLAWKNWDKIVGIVQRVYQGVKTWIMDKLNAVFNWVGNKLKWVGDQFFKLYDRVVGHSYIPDMVDEIGFHIDRLDEEMVQPAIAAIQQTDAAFQQLGANAPDNVGAALEKLPTLAEQANEAIKNVAMDGIRSLADGLTAVVMGTAKLGDVFRQVAQQIISELIRIQIQKMLMSIASSAFGMPAPAFGGMRAAGGPVMSGKSYIVGERGPELFMPGSSGQIVPNHAMGGGMSVTNNFSIAGPVSRQTELQIASAARRGIAQANRKGAA